MANDNRGMLDITRHENRDPEAHRKRQESASIGAFIDPLCQHLLVAFLDHGGGQGLNSEYVAAGTVTFAASRPTAQDA